VSPTAALSLVFDILAKSDRASREFDKVGDDSERMGKRVGKAGDDGGRAFGGGIKAGVVLAAGALATLGLAKIAQFSSGAVDAFASVEDATGAATVQFGKALPSVLAFADKASTSFGLSKRAALEAQNTFGTLGKAAGLSGEPLAKFSGKLTGLAGDLASFKGTSTEQAIEAVGAALRGESEPIRAYGVLLDDAALRQEALALGLIKTTKQALTPQQKALAAQSAILKQTTDAQGDYNRTSSSTANVQKTLAAETENAKAAFGEKLAPAITAVRQGFLGIIKASTGVLDKLAPLGEAARQVVDVLFKGDFTGGPFAEDSPIIRGLFTIREGIADFVAGFKLTEDQTKAFGGALDGAAAAGNRVGSFLRAAKEAVGNFVAGLTLSKEQTAAYGGALEGAAAAGSLIGTVLRDVVLPRLQDVAGFIRDVVVPGLQSAADFIGRNSEAFASLAAGFVAVAAAAKIYSGIQAALNVVLLANPVGAIVAGLALLVGGLIFAYRESETFRNAVNAVAERVGAFAQDIGTRLVPVVREFATLMQEKVTTGLELLRQKFEENRPQIELFIGGLKVMFDGFQKIAGYIVSEVLPVLGKFVGFLVERVFVDLGKFIGIFAAIVGAAAGALSGFMGMVSGMLGGIQQVFGALGQIPGEFGDKFRRAADSVGQAKGSVDALKFGLDTLKSKDIAVTLDTGPARRELEAFVKSTGGTIRVAGVLGSRGGLLEGTGDGPGRGGAALARVSRIIAGSGARVTSTYRSPAQNRAVGGSPSSYHMDRANPAVDIAGPTGVLDRLFPTLRAAGGWRELLWRVPGHFDHIHAAHNGLKIGPGLPRLPGDGPNERTLRTLVGERVLNPQETRDYEGGGGSAVTFAPTLLVRDRADADLILRDFEFRVRAGAF